MRNDGSCNEGRMMGKMKENVQEKKKGGGGKEEKKMRRTRRRRRKKVFICIYKGNRHLPNLILSESTIRTAKGL